MKETPKSDSPFESLKVVGAVQLVMFGLVWVGFGLFAFFKINAWGHEYDRKMALISAGQVPPQTLHIVTIGRNENSTESSIKLGGLPDGKFEYRKTSSTGGLKVGAPVTAYKFDDGYLIPQFDTGGHHWGKWIFLAFGVVPPAIVAGGIAFSRSRKKKRALEEGPVDPFLPPAFSTDRIAFERTPADAQLLALLGSKEVMSDIVIDDKPDVLSARPRLIPMKFVVLWMIFIATLITAMPWIAPRFGGKFAGSMAWLMIAMVWFAVLPTMFGILYALNKYLSSQGDYFRVDRRKQTLELLQLPVTLHARQIDCFTEVDRWQFVSKESARVRQTGVLARKDDGGFEHYPVLRQRGWRRSQESPAEKLSRIFNRPVRKIKRGFRESRALRDRPQDG